MPNNNEKQSTSSLLGSSIPERIFRVAAYSGKMVSSQLFIILAVAAAGFPLGVTIGLISKRKLVLSGVTMTMSCGIFGLSNSAMFETIAWLRSNEKTRDPRDIWTSASATGLTSTVWGTIFGSPLLGLRSGALMSVVGAVGHLAYDASVSWYRAVAEDRFVSKYGHPSAEAIAAAAQAEKDLKSLPTYNLLNRNDESWPHHILPLFRINDEEIEKLIQEQVDRHNNEHC